MQGVLDNELIKLIDRLVTSLSCFLLRHYARLLSLSVDSSHQPIFPTSFAKLIKVEVENV